MKRLAVYIIMFAMLGIAGCPCIDPPPPKPALRIARCVSADVCGPQQTCDPVTQACVDVCDQPCAVDQVRVQTASGGCTCANTDGVGSPCLTDGDCASVSGSTAVRQLCRSIASPEPGWPATSVCVHEPSCTVGTSECGDPELSAQIEATCLAVVSNPPGPGTCTTTCVDASGTTRTNCRIDQVPTVTASGTCTCVSRRDPFGDGCAVDADCAWAAGILGNAGPTRVCKLVGSKKTCVPTDFCIKEEVKGTCGNGVDDDCDGTADVDENACTVSQCADRDTDGYCDRSSCSVRKPIAAQHDRPESECRNREAAACDAPGMGTRNPGVLEVCNGIDDNCDVNLTVDENCPPACVPSTEVCDGRDNDCNGVSDDSIAATSCVAQAAGVCSAGRNVCVNGRLECQAGPAQSEVCDGVDNNCDGLADPMGTCEEVIVRQQSDSDNGREMTVSPGLPTDLIDTYRTHGGPCGEDDHGRPYYRTRAEVSAWSGHGALCELAGPYGGYVSPDKTDCKIRVHYKTTRMGSNVWCSGTWWATPVGAYRR